MRLQKFLAHCGVASRRKSEELIRAGLVQVNGQVIKDPATDVSQRDQIYFKGKRLTFEPKVIYKMNKPKKVISTVKDPRGRKTVLDFYQGDLRLYPIGRLDYDSEGLILLTNDGELSHRLLHPRYEMEKVYHVKTHRPLKTQEMKRLAQGVRIEPNYVTQPIKIKKISQGYEMILKEGRNRQIRRMLEVIGVRVTALKRLAMGPIQLGDLKSGQLVQLNAKENQALKEWVDETCSTDK